MTKIILAKSNFMSWQLHHWNGQLANYAIAYSTGDSSFRKFQVWKVWVQDFRPDYEYYNVMQLWNKHLQMSEKFTFYSRLSSKGPPAHFPLLIPSCNAYLDIRIFVLLSETKKHSFHSLDSLINFFYCCFNCATEMIPFKRVSMSKWKWSCQIC